MVEQPSRDPPIVLWELGEWRCEHRCDPNGLQWADLYRAGQLAVSRPVRDAGDVPTLSASWRALADGTAHDSMPEPTRRRNGERRHTTRGGRRHTDRAGEGQTPEGSG